MTALYRRDVAEPPFGRGTFWTMRPEGVEWLAKWETEGRPLSDSRVYQAEVTIGDDITDQPIEQVPKLSGELLRPDDLREWSQQSASLGFRWMQFTDHDDPWYFVILYLDEEPISAQPMAE